jgi:hypothetical protein
MPRCGSKSLFDAQNGISAAPAPELPNARIPYSTCSWDPPPNANTVPVGGRGGVYEEEGHATS